MTSEERWTKIENALETVAEGQAKHSIDIAELDRLHKSLVVGVLKLNEAQRETQKQLDKQAKNTQKQLDQLTRNIDRFLKGLGSNGKRQR